MSASDADAWARLRLVQGRSSAELWELVHALGHSMLTVGSGAGCSWIVEEAGVSPVHFSLHWDGSALRIADTHGAGNVRVDGAPITAEWRLISGRARIDFGQAAIVVETSAGSPPDLGHPLDRSSLPPLTAEVRRGSSHPPQSDVAPRPVPKATLLGVAPLTGQGAPIVASVPARTPAPTAPITHEVTGVPGQTDSFRPKRPSDQARAPKPTLLGMAQLTPSGAPVSSAPTPIGARPSAPNIQHTLHGTGDVSSARPAQRLGGASLSEGDQRTMQGFPAATPSTTGAVTVSVGGSASSVPPSRRETQRGVISAPPGQVPGAVMQARVKPISDHAPPSRQTWPEEGQGTPVQVVEPAPPLGDDALAGHGPGRSIPQAVLVGAAPDAPYATPHDRLSDAPTEMRDVTHFESRRPRRSFPWQYVGLGLLTVLAYAAWLYLLDHL